MAHWTDKLPELGDKFLNEANRIVSRRAELERQLAELADEEAALYQSIAATGEWSDAEMTAVIIDLPWDVVERLDDRRAKR